MSTAVAATIAPMTMAMIKVGSMLRGYPGRGRGNGEPRVFAYG
jgi:hypothetical protein